MGAEVSQPCRPAEAPRSGCVARSRALRQDPGMTADIRDLHIFREKIVVAWAEALRLGNTRLAAILMKSIVGIDLTIAEINEIHARTLPQVEALNGWSERSSASAGPSHARGGTTHYSESLHLSGFAPRSVSSLDLGRPSGRLFFFSTTTLHGRWVARAGRGGRMFRIIAN